MRLLLLLPLVVVVVGCADEKVVEACGKRAEACGIDQTACITDRQSHLGEIQGRCGAAYDEAVAVYVCQGELDCDADYEEGCRQELSAYDDVIAAGDGGCDGAPDPVEP